MNPPREIWVVVDKDACVEDAFDTEQGAVALCRWHNSNSDCAPYSVVHYVIAEGGDHAKV